MAATGDRRPWCVERFWVRGGSGAAAGWVAGDADDEHGGCPEWADRPCGPALGVDAGGGQKGESDADDDWPVVTDDEVLDDLGDRAEGRHEASVGPCGLG